MKKRKNIYFYSTSVIGLLFLLFSYCAVFGQGKVIGELKKWHKVTIDFNGPQVSETDEYNPFFNYRLNVTFTHAESGKKYKVPGYFAADGNAAQTSANSGNIWRVHFAPDEIGEWSYEVDFRKGNWAAISDKLKTGASGEFMDKHKGTFTILPSDKTGKDFRAKGRLSYIGQHYLQFEETKEYFIKQGPDAPENLLSYADFDGTFQNDGHGDNFIKNWQPHLQDWKEGDPTWQGERGKALIGALNYLASKGMNAFSFLTLNIMGDDKNVFPYIDYDSYDRIDVSKLDQWEILFNHAQKLGLFLHFKTSEVENQGLLDNGGVGAYRKLYYRELIARFGHHLALNWNLGEENGDWVKNHQTPPQFTQQRLAMAQYFYDKDPYHHHIVIHNGNPFDDLLGDKSKITGPSVQTSRQDFSLVHRKVIEWREKSVKAGKLWAVAVDEPGDAQHSLLPDSENPEHNLARKNALWGALMAGAWGVEWYFGYKHEHSDLTCQDWRSRDLFWEQCKYALDFFTENNLPLVEMNPSDGLLSTEDYCFAKTDEVYVVYLKNGGETKLDLENANGEFMLKWFNPRTGQYLNKEQKIKAGKKAMINSPEDNDLDWVALIRK